MATTGLRAPIATRRAIIVLGVVSIAAAMAILQVDAATRISSQSLSEDTNLTLATQCINSSLTGCVYGLTLGWCWLATALPWRYRFPAILAMVALASYTLQLKNDLSQVRYLVSLGGMVVAQYLAFFLAGISDWSSRPDNTNQRRSQFSVVSVLALTTGMAILLSLAIGYHPPIDREVYWSGLVASWLGLPVIMVCLCVAALTNRRGMAVAWLTMGLLALLAACWCLALYDHRATEQEFDRLFPMYLSLIGTTAATVLCFAFAACLTKSR